MDQKLVPLKRHVKCVHCGTESNWAYLAEHYEPSAEKRGLWLVRIYKCIKCHKIIITERVWVNGD